MFYVLIDEYKTKYPHYLVKVYALKYFFQFCLTQARVKYFSVSKMKIVSHTK